MIAESLYPFSLVDFFSLVDTADGSASHLSALEVVILLGLLERVIGFEPTTLCLASTVSRYRDSRQRQGKIAETRCPPRASADSLAPTESAPFLAFTGQSVYNTSTMTQARETKGRGADAPGGSARGDLRAMLRPSTLTIRLASIALPKIVSFISKMESWPIFVQVIGRERDCSKIVSFRVK